MRGKLFLVALVILSVLSSMTAFAADDYYVVSNTTHYVNPVTGASNDGGDTSVGEGMCRNSTYQYTFIEKNASGGAMVTLRLKSASFIKNIAITVQSSQGSDTYNNVSHTVVGNNKDENTMDLQFEVSSTALYIKPEFYVEPMKRDVTYFVNINGSALRDADKLALFGKEPLKEEPVKTQEPEATAQAPTQQTSVAQAPASAKPAEATDAPTKTPEVTKSPEGTTAPSPLTTEEAATTDEPAAELEDTEESAETLGIVEFEAENAEGIPEEASPNTNDMNPWMIAGIVIVVLASGIVAFILIKKKRK